MPSNVPNVNASLIREVRMIINQFFRHKESETFWGSRASKPQIAVLKCGVCMEFSNRPKDAITVYDGTAMCQPHAGVAIASRD